MPTMLTAADPPKSPCTTLKPLSPVSYLEHVEEPS
jgi:hypothetical protein